jgi:uncharacterized protein (DUF1810 family)
MDTDKFIEAQNPIINIVLSELRSGRKKTHWIWFIFPQLKELGQSDMAIHFGLDGLQDARDWLAHPILSARLLDCTRAVLMHPKKPIGSIMEFPDDLKLHSSITLFQLANPSQQLFTKLLKVFYKGQPDLNTLELLNKSFSFLPLQSSGKI